ncbi:unnamed protein product, partial [Closterium sp. NIES-54]
MVVPQLQNVGALAVAISILGATVMPHNLFLHSAIVLSRKHAGTTRAIRTASHYSFLELFLALLISVVINVAIISVAGAVCHSASLPPGAAQACANISISNAHVLLTLCTTFPSSLLFSVSPTLVCPLLNLSMCWAEGQRTFFLTLPSSPYLSEILHISHPYLPPTLPQDVPGGWAGSQSEVMLRLMIGRTGPSSPYLSPYLTPHTSHLTPPTSHLPHFSSWIPHQDVLGKWAGTLFGVALLAAGQSSTVTGTYAGQYVMQGFIELRISTWLRNLITRSVAIVPALLVALLFGAQGASLLIILCS